MFPPLRQQPHSSFSHFILFIGNIVVLNGINRLILFSSMVRQQNMFYISLKMSLLYRKVFQLKELKSLSIWVYHLTRNYLGMNM